MITHQNSAALYVQTNIYYPWGCRPELIFMDLNMYSMGFIIVANKNQLWQIGSYFYGSKYVWDKKL
jgi:hypothetical protein